MPEAARTTALSYGATDQGPRDNNEDQFHCDDERGIYFVVDGMGGHAAGEHAAAIAKARLIGRLERPVGTVEQRIREAIALANNAIFEAAQTNPDWFGMACVLTVAVIDQGEVVIGHVGDSRLYRVLPDRVEKITLDHSPVGRLEDEREIAEIEAMKHPRRNEVFRDVGSERHEPAEPGFIDIYRIPFDQSSAFLLCSDGLSDVLTSEEIHAVVMESAPDRARVVRNLIRAALENPKDNTTVVLVQGPAFAQSLSGRRRKIATKPKQPVSRGRKTTAVPAAIADTEIETRYLIPDEAPRRNWWATIGLMAVAFVAGSLATIVAQWLLRPATPIPVDSSSAPVFLRVRPGTEPRPITAALEKARSGDTIEIAAGEYVDQIKLKNGVRLIATDATLRPPADMPSTDAVISATGIEQASVSGIRIQAPKRGEFPFGIQVTGGQIDISHVHISGAKLAAIEYSGDATGSIDSCVLKDNPGAGILIRERAAPSVTRNSFLNNGRQGASRLPGLHIASLKSIQVSGNTFAGNAAEAIWQPEPASTALLNENTFGANQTHGTLRDVRIVGPPRTEP